jgi:hypothetical protein
LKSGSQFVELFHGAQQDRLSRIQQSGGRLIVNFRGHEAEHLNPNGKDMNRHPATPVGGETKDPSPAREQTGKSIRTCAIDMPTIHYFIYQDSHLFSGRSTRLRLHGVSVIISQ